MTLPYGAIWVVWKDPLQPSFVGTRYFKLELARQFEMHLRKLVRPQKEI
jgi:hypothetical protein